MKTSFEQLLESCSDPKVKEMIRAFQHDQELPGNDPIWRFVLLQTQLQGYHSDIIFKSPGYMKAAAEKLLEAQEQAGQKILENVEKEAAAKLDIVLSSFFDMVNDRLIVAEKGYDKNREAALYYQAKRYFFRGITVGLISFCVGMIAGGPIMEVFFTVIKNALAWL